LNDVTQHVALLGIESVYAGRQFVISARSTRLWPEESTKRDGVPSPESILSAVRVLQVGAHSAHQLLLDTNRLAASVLHFMFPASFRKPRNALSTVRAGGATALRGVFCHPAWTALFLSVAAKLLAAITAGGKCATKTVTAALGSGVHCVATIGTCSGGVGVIHGTPFSPLHCTGDQDVAL